MAKRLFDLLLGAVGVVILSPILLSIAIAVRVDSRGPIFFRQERVGRGGRPFRIHKFRTMRVDRSGLARQITVGRDPRITRVGHVLRQTKLDELPQLIDVVTGKMSLVGPRPEVPAYVRHYPDAIRGTVLSVRPGITDASSLRFIDEAGLLATASDPERFYIDEILPVKLAHHLEYVRNRSLIGDAAIIVETLRSIFVRRY